MEYASLPFPRFVFGQFCYFCIYEIWNVICCTAFSWNWVKLMTYYSQFRPAAYWFPTAIYLSAYRTQVCGRQDIISSYCPQMKKEQVSILERQCVSLSPPSGDWSNSNGKKGEERPSCSNYRLFFNRSLLKAQAEARNVGTGRECRSLLSFIQKVEPTVDKTI